MRLLWQEEVASYHGQFVDFDQVRCDPSPPRGTVPTPRRWARHRRRCDGPPAYGDGYFPYVGPGYDLHATLRR